MIKKLKYYISDGLDPYRNLAIEKYLFDTVGDDCLILYLWQNKNTVVIGRNQNPWAECNCSLLSEEGGKLARRLSGGGAVFHDIGNLNFTFLCSTENYNTEKQMSVIKEACSLAGIETELSGRNDILAEGRKFSGNAFYNSKGKSYHHGTLLICADTEKMTRYLTPTKAKLEAKGVKSVKSRVVNLSSLSMGLTCKDMIENMLSSFKTVYGHSAEPFNIRENEKISLLEEKFKSKEFIYKSTIPFTFSCEGYCKFGHIRILLEINEGEIANAQVFTDFMDADIAEKTESALKGCFFETHKIREELLKTLPEKVAQEIVNIINN